MPDWIFAFCGRVDKSPEEAEHMRPWRALIERANVRYHGELSPERIAELAKDAKLASSHLLKARFYASRFRFRKAYEYVACGLPVVSVPITALAEDPANFDIASTPEEFAASILNLAPTRSEDLRAWIGGWLQLRRWATMNDSSSWKSGFATS